MSFSQASRLGGESKIVMVPPMVLASLGCNICQSQYTWSITIRQDMLLITNATPSESIGISAALTRMVKKKGRIHNTAENGRGVSADRDVPGCVHAQEAVREPPLKLGLERRDVLRRGPHGEVEKIGRREVFGGGRAEEIASETVRIVVKLAPGIRVQAAHSRVPRSEIDRHTTR